MREDLVKKAKEVNRVIRKQLEVMEKSMLLDDLIEKLRKRGVKYVYVERKDRFQLILPSIFVGEKIEDLYNHPAFLDFETSETTMMFPMHLFKIEKLD